MSEITSWPLCWPDNVPRTVPHLRSYPQFQQRSIASAVNYLRSEINRLNDRRWDYNDTGVIISSNLRQRQDGLPASGQTEPADTGIAVYFTLRFLVNGKRQERPIARTCDKWNRVNYNITAIAKDIELDRAKFRYGASNISQSYRGYLAIPEQCGGKSWWNELGIPPTATLQQIKDAYHAKAKTAHTDVGGKREDWDRIQRAYDQAQALFRGNT